MTRAEGSNLGYGAIRVIAWLKKRGDVDPLDVGQSLQQRWLVLAEPFCLACRLGDLRDCFLAVSQQDGIKKWRQGFWVIGAGATGYYQWKCVFALVRKQRHACQTEHIEDIGVGKLVLEGEANDVALCQRCGGFQC